MFNNIYIYVQLNFLSMFFRLFAFLFTAMVPETSILGQTCSSFLGQTSSSTLLYPISLSSGFWDDHHRHPNINTELDKDSIWRCLDTWIRSETMLCFCVTWNLKHKSFKLLRSLCSSLQLLGRILTKRFNFLLENNRRKWTEVWEKMGRCPIGQILRLGVTRYNSRSPSRKKKEKENK